MNGSCVLVYVEPRVEGSRILDQNLWRWAEVFGKSRQKHLPMPHLLSSSISISLNVVILKDDMLKNL